MERNFAQAASNVSRITRLNDQDIRPLNKSGTLHFGVNFPLEELATFNLEKTEKDYRWYTQSEIRVRPYRYVVDDASTRADHFYEIDELLTVEGIMEWANAASASLLNDIPADWDGYILLDNETIVPVGEFWGRWGHTGPAEEFTEEEIDAWDKKSLPALEGFLWRMKMTFPNAKVAWYHVPKAKFFGKNHWDKPEGLVGTHEKLKSLLAPQGFLDAHSYQAGTRVTHMQDASNKYDYHAANMAMMKQYAIELGIKPVASFWMQGAGDNGAWDTETIKIWFSAAKAVGIEDVAVLAGVGQWRGFSQSSSLPPDDFWNLRVVQPAVEAGYLL